MASDADLDHVIDTLTAAFAQGRLTSQELDLRAGQAFAARTLAELADLTADLPAGMTRTRPAPKPARARPRQPVDQAVAWCAWGLITPALIAVALAIPDPTPTDNKPIGKILSLVTVVYFIAWLVVGATDAPHLVSAAPPAGRPASHGAKPARRGRMTRPPPANDWFPWPTMLVAIIRGSCSGGCLSGRGSVLRKCVTHMRRTFPRKRRGAGVSGPLVAGAAGLAAAGGIGGGGTGSTTRLLTVLAVA